jgi:hypothetical protein
LGLTQFGNINAKEFVRLGTTGAGVFYYCTTWSKVTKDVSMVSISKTSVNSSLVGHRALLLTLKEMNILIGIVRDSTGIVLPSSDRFLSASTSH